MKYFITYIILVSFITIGCNPVATLYGIKQNLNGEGCDKVMKKYKQLNTIEINALKYENFIKNNIDSIYFNHFSQPLQVLHFVNGELYSHSANCNAQGFPNLNWNFKYKDTKYLQGNIDNICPLSLDIYLENLTLSDDLKLKLKRQEHVTLVLINCIMNRQTSILVNELKNNVNNSNVYYIDNSKFYLYK